MPYPLIFKPVYKAHLWGGNRIQTLFHRTGCPPQCAESWEISARSEGMSVVANGAMTGKSLQDLFKTLGHDLTGTACQAHAFPLLIKIIDATERLSVQVHPDETTAHSLHGEPKTEMWYVLHAAPGACVYAGLKDGTSPKELEKALAAGTVESCLHVLSVSAGQSVFLPGGRIHAIGAGCLMLEIQQSSHTTYRLFDWHRKDKDGHHRELHMDKALKAVNWKDSPAVVTAPVLFERQGPNSFYELASCPYFRITLLELTVPETVSSLGASFRALFAASGTVEIRWNGSTLELPRGTSCLLPAALRDYTLAPSSGTVQVVSTTLF